ncbi:MAG TPA: hypothetical protein PLP91_01045 [Plasticicumulans sp.]|nr:hypothetical protein [Plasticicumulans sp.]
MSDHPPVDAVLRIELLERFRQLHESLDALATAIGADQDRAAWLDEAPVTEIRTRAATLIRDIWYGDEVEDARMTVTSIGLIGCCAETLTLAQAANAAKDAFKTVVLQFRGKTSERNRALAEMLETWHARDPDLARALSAGGIGRVHLVQAYRHVPVLDETPVRVGFSYASSARAIRALTRDQALELVEALPDTHAARAVYRQMLSQYPDSERFAQMRNLAPNLVANLVFRDGYGEEERVRRGVPVRVRVEQVRRKLLHVHLPILFPLAAGAPLPAHPARGPQVRSAASRLLRSDRRIDGPPLIPALRLYRYREPD